MSKASMNKDKLIRMMYERPVLWNHKHVDYRSGQLKHQGWLEIANEFNMTDEEVKKKWACIRDTFRRELKKILKLSTETTPYITKWPYFEKLLFLKDTMDARKSFIDETEDEIELVDENIKLYKEEEFEEVNEEHNNVSEVPYTFGNFQIVPRKVSIISDPLACSRGITESSKKRNAISAELQTSNDISKNKKKLDIIEDDDYHFVMSILPALRKVSDKMQVRMDIMNIIVAADLREKLS